MPFFFHVDASPYQVFQTVLERVWKKPDKAKANTKEELHAFGVSLALPDLIRYGYARLIQCTGQ